MKAWLIAALMIALTGAIVIELHGSGRQARVATPVADTHEDEVGRIATSSAGFTYTSDKYGFSFSYPTGWHVGDNHIGYGTFQLFNYDEATASGKSVFPAGENKIEAAICDSLRGYTLDTDDYPDMTVQDSNLRIQNHPAIRSDVDLGGGQQIRSYSVRLRQEGNALCISMYGDPANFSVLYTLVQSLDFGAAN